MAKGKRVCIVFEETDDSVTMTDKTGPGFNVFLEGADRCKTLPVDAWSAAEFHALRCFQIITATLQKAGAVTQIKQKGGT